tara:strand:+ start:315 stop:572 length:258 start_codon:yes stop_codon:yes gene_type:complete
MQKSNNFFDNLVEFLKSNNIKIEDILEKFFNKEINTSKIDLDMEKNDNKSKQDLENDNDYELLVTKLSKIQKNMDQLSLEISKNN